MKRKETIMVTLLLCSACAQQQRIATLGSIRPRAELQLDAVSVEKLSLDSESKPDTIKVEMEGREFLLMRATQDDSGQMVAHDEIEAAVVTARFRNVTERNGKVEIAFNITVPPSMQDAEWQVRFFPFLTVMDSTTMLDGVFLTGKEYDRARERGYRLYNEFIESIIPDDADFESVFTYRHGLEVFIQRNMPQLWALKQDSTYHDVNQFDTHYGVSYDQALDYFTKHYKIKLNESRKASIEKMHSRYVDRFSAGPSRIDSVISHTNGSKTYRYVHTIRTRFGMTKAYLTLSGEIWNRDGCIYRMPDSDSLTYYISTLNSFADTTTRYMMEIIRRNVEANISENIEFLVGRSDIDESLADNALSLKHIRNTVTEMLSNREYTVDSLIIRAGCSPEGRMEDNRILASARAKSMMSYLTTYSKEIPIEYFVDLQDGKGDDIRGKTLDIRIGECGESWNLLYELIKKDSALSDAEKADLLRVETISDLDKREETLREKMGYQHVRKEIYPYLRRVDLDFYLHRKGMEKDTIHSERVNLEYMEGLSALLDYDYSKAISLLGPYRDLNAAISYLNGGYEKTAVSILSTLEQTPEIDYLLAVGYIRLGEDSKAAIYLQRAIKDKNSLIFRANLDPEISSLIKEFNMEELTKCEN